MSAVNLFASLFLWRNRGVFSCSLFFLLVAPMTAQKLNGFHSDFKFFFHFGEAKAWLNVLFLVATHSRSRRYHVRIFMLEGRRRLLSFRNVALSPAHDMCRRGCCYCEWDAGGWADRAANRMFKSKQNESCSVVNERQTTCIGRTESGGGQALIAPSRERIFRTVVANFMFSSSCVFEWFCWQRCTDCALQGARIVLIYSCSLHGKLFRINR